MKRRRWRHGHADACGHGCHGGRRRHGWRRGLNHVLARLGTTPAQEKVIRDELNRLRELGGSSRGEAFAARGDLADALRAEALDPTQFDALVARLDGAYGSLRTAAIDSLRRVHATLDAHQREQLADFLARKREAGSGPFRT